MIKIWVAFKIEEPNSTRYIHIYFYPIINLLDNNNTLKNSRIQLRIVGFYIGILIKNSVASTTPVVSCN